jgi:hypothetical protein
MEHGSKLWLDETDELEQNHTRSIQPRSPFRLRPSHSPCRGQHFLDGPFLFLVFMRALSFRVRVLWPVPSVQVPQTSFAKDAYARARILPAARDESGRQTQPSTLRAYSLRRHGRVIPWREDTRWTHFGFGFASFPTTLGQLPGNPVAPPPSKFSAWERRALFGRDTIYLPAVTSGDHRASFL